MYTNRFALTMQLHYIYVLLSLSTLSEIAKTRDHKLVTTDFTYQYIAVCRHVLQ